MLTAYRGGQIFDGRQLLDGRALCLRDGVVEALCDEADISPEAEITELAGRVICPGFVDLQLNGGGGVMFDAAPSVESLRQIGKAHWALGTRHLLPTLITSEKDVTKRAIQAVTKAIAQGLPGIRGIHLEGPHLSQEKCGAHDPALIRVMEPSDVETLLDAADRIPYVMVTVAPESVTPAQVKTLSDAGIVVSLGHSNADFAACTALFDAGARGATHLFNAMSQLNSRAPGLVGAALDHPEVTCGLIADGVHVHPRSLALALATKAADRFYLITDAMAVAGTDAQAFHLGTREVVRRNGVLRLSDGTLAGADLTMPQALRVMVADVGVPLEQALKMAIEVPATLMGLPQEQWMFKPGAPCDPVILDPVVTPKR